MIEKGLGVELWHAQRIPGSKNAICRIAMSSEWSVYE